MSWQKQPDGRPSSYTRKRPDDGPSSYARKRISDAEPEWDLPSYDEGGVDADPTWDGGPGDDDEDG